MTTLTLAPDLKLPLELATSTTLAVGKRGAGKSNTAVVMAEELYARGIPFAVLDPVDVWWGLKAGKDGKPEGGLKVYVFGGEHGDLPLEPTAGVLMADVLVEHRISAVFVLRQFSNRDKARFVSDFAEQLFKRNREVLHLFCEEAHEVMPQNPYRGEEEMLGRMLKLQKLGRSSGIGLTSITQRPASLNKNATTQAEILLAHRLLGPQDVKAIEEWIKHHHGQDQKAQLLGSLHELKTGQCWVWAPDFPEEAPIGLRRVQIRQAKTYDSRRTPKPGERQMAPEAMVPVDLDRLRTKMAGTIEKAKAEDPKALRAKIADLQRELNLAQRVTAPKSPSVKENRVEVPVISDKQIARLEKLVERASAFSTRIEGDARAIQQSIKDVIAQMGKFIAGKNQPPVIPSRYDLSPRVRTPTHITPPAEARELSRQMLRDRLQTSGNRPAAGISRPQQKILDGLAWLRGLGLDRADRVRAAMLADQSPRSSGYEKNVSTLKTAGLIDYPGPGELALTDAGAALATPPDIPFTNAALHEQIRKHLSGPQWVLLNVLINAYPAALMREELATRASASAVSSGFEKNVSTLRSLGFLDYPAQGQVKAEPVLFVE